jgi:hypothetical protein
LGRAEPRLPGSNLFILHSAWCCEPGVVSQVAGRSADFHRVADHCHRQPPFASWAPTRSDQHHGPMDPSLRSPHQSWQ